MSAEIFASYDATAWLPPAQIASARLMKLAFAGLSVLVLCPPPQPASASAAAAASARAARGITSEPPS